MPPTMERIVRTLAEVGGYRPGTGLENRVAYRLARLGHTADRVRQQHRAGAYRLDFAWPDIAVALEVDGWHHRSPEGASKDARRDAWLRGHGWLVLRVDDQSDLDAQVCRVVEAVNGLTR